METISKNTLYKVCYIYDNMIDTLDRVLIGQNMVKKIVVASILCDTNSRILFTGNTGMGKTTLANFLAQSFNSERISVTSDMIPMDIQEQLKNNLNLQFLQIDEFNRASGKVQSAFIELLAENQLYIGGKKYPFKDFYVVATENGEDIAGIFNVPQAVYDRFDVSVAFDTLTDEEKRELFFSGFEPDLDKKLDIIGITLTKEAVDSFKMRREDEDLILQIFNIIDTLTYNDKKIFAGSNIRAHKFAIKLAKFNALIDGRTTIKPRDFADFINYLYSHRVNQRVVRMDNQIVQERFDDARTRILSLGKKV